MNISGKPIYLPIRSLGDFVMTASVLKLNSLEKVPIIIPLYLIDLFEAMEANKFFDSLGTIPFKDQPAFFEFYKVRDLKNLKRLVDDVEIIRGSLNKKKQYLLDFRSRRLFFANKVFEWPNDKGNAYESKYNMFSKKFQFKPNSSLSEIENYNVPVKNVVIFPDSRVKIKEIDKKLLSEILIRYGSKCNIHIAKFSSIPSKEKNAIVYSDFKALISIILNNDFIISAESLPYHLCNYYNKPHFVIYKKVKHFNIEFRTSFMKLNNSYHIYDGINTIDFFRNLDKMLLGGNSSESDF